MAHVARHNDHTSTHPPDAQAKLDSLIRVGCAKLAHALGITETTLHRLAGGGTARAETVERITAALRRVA